METPNIICWWVAPYYQQTKIGIRQVMMDLPKEYIVGFNRQEFRIDLVNGSSIWFKSADNPDALRGEGVWFMIVDEAAMIKEDTWNDVLRPTLADGVMKGGGKAIFISTPKGLNWFYDIWKEGQDQKNHNYVQSWKFTTRANRYIAPEEIEAARKTLPELSFKQEWEAEFLSDIGAVFRNIEGCIKIPGKFDGQTPYEIIKPDNTSFYYIGVDLAKHQDFTVITVVDDKGRLCFFDRFNNIDWIYQSARILEISKKYNRCRIIIDSTGVGDPIYDYLVKYKSVEGFKFTSDSKANLVQNLSIALENTEIQYPNLPVLIEELRAFGYERSEVTGRFKYGAPPGKHDDCVMALGMSVWLLKTSNGLAISILDTKKLFGTYINTKPGNQKPIRM